MEAGGLFIVGTERHESRRIDNQLRGRAGRQGDPGESRFFLSAEDDLVLDQDGFKVFIDPFSAQYINGVMIDYVTSMQGSGFTFKNPNATGGCGCGSSFAA